MYKTGIGFMLLGVLLLIVAEKDILSIVISFLRCYLCKTLMRHCLVV